MRRVANDVATMDDGSRVSAGTGRKVKVISQEGFTGPAPKAGKKATKAAKAAERAAMKKAAAPAKKAAPAPKTESGGSYADRQQAIRDVLAQKTESSRAPQGQQAQTAILTAPDGSRVFRKKFKGEDDEAKTLADNEELGALSMDALGIPVPAMVRKDNRTVDMEFITGKLGTDIVLDENRPMSGVNGPPARIRDSDNGRLIGIMDFLTDNFDRNPGN